MSVLCAADHSFISEQCLRRRLNDLSDCHMLDLSTMQWTDITHRVCPLFVTQWALLQHSHTVARASLGSSCLALGRWRRVRVWMGPSSCMEVMHAQTLMRANLLQGVVCPHSSVHR